MTFTVANIKIKIGFLFFAGIAMLLCMNASSIVRISLVSALLHEGGHIAALLLSGDKPQKISFGLFGISIVRRNDVSLDYKQEIITAFCGPATNLLLCLVSFCCYAAFSDKSCYEAAFINAFLAIFNLLPIFGLDGGRMLEFALLLRLQPAVAENRLRLVSMLFLIPLFIMGFYVLIASQYNFSLFLLSCYLVFLFFVRCK